MSVHKAIVEAACQRLRAVLLTSLTTIAGLTPILFETSLQAQFLIPMATSLVFGLAFGTLLILLVVPALLVMLENAKAIFKSTGNVTLGVPSSSSFASKLATFVPTTASFSLNVASAKAV